MVLDLIRNYEPILVIGILVLLFLLLMMEIINRVSLNKLEKRYRKLMKGSGSKNIEELVLEYNGKVEKSLESSKNIEEMYSNIENRLNNCIQKCSVVRYRAFDDVGSDLSFSIALLDQRNDGVVVTGIYGRSECTTFAKPIENGISKYDLSDEEKVAIKNAINNK